MELAKQYPQVSITVQAADLLALGSSIVADTMARYRAEIEARERAEKEEKMLTAQEAGEMLGVCDRTLYRWRRAGYIEGVRVGGVINGIAMVFVAITLDEPPLPDCRSTCSRAG